MAPILIVLGSMVGFLGGAVAFLIFGTSLLAALSIWAATGLAAMLIGVVAAWANARSQQDDETTSSEETV